MTTIEYGKLTPTPDYTNSLYLIPAAENGGTPCVCVWSGVGPGTPDGAWLYLADVPGSAVADELELALRGVEAELVELAATYRGSWSDDHALECITDAVSSVPQYCEASEWFRPVSIADVVRNDLDLDELVDDEVDQAQDNADPAVHLDPADVRGWIVASAERWLSRHDDPTDDNDRDAALRARLRRLLEASV